MAFLLVGGLVSTGVTLGAIYTSKKITRRKLKKGDPIIQEEAARERAAARLNATTKIHHNLHPHHELLLVHDTTSFRCDTCRQLGEGYHYRCNTCDFNLHEACAASDEIFSGLTAEETVHKTFVHDHPLTLISGFINKCKYCKTEINEKQRYYCKECKKHFHMMCVIHPARLTSFIHPQHELVLKTKQKNKAKCAVCNYAGHSDVRVYSCESCEFYLHSDCAVRAQHLKHHLHHANHTLVYGAVSSYKKVKCAVCKFKCKHWSYSCSVCEDVHIHHTCLYPPATEKPPSKTEVGLHLVAGVVDGLGSAAGINSGTIPHRVEWEKL